MNIIPDGRSSKLFKYRHVKRKIKVPEPQLVKILPNDNNLGSSFTDLQLSANNHGHPISASQQPTRDSNLLNEPQLRTVEPHVVNPLKVDPFLPKLK